MGQGADGRHSRTSRRVETIFKSEHPSARGRCGSEVEQELQRPRDPDERFVVNGTDPRDEPLIGDRLDVFAFRVADLVAGAPIGRYGAVCLRRAEQQRGRETVRELVLTRLNL
jgi:hypothetical protein